MKRHAFLLLITLSAVTACRKNIQGNNSGYGSTTGDKVTVTTVAGEGTAGFADGSAFSARFKAPYDVAVAADGTLYVTDFRNTRIRKIANGQVSTLAGSGEEGVVNGNGSAAEFEDPYRMAVDGAGNLYVLDDSDPRIRKISPAADVTVYTGTQQPGFLNGDISLAQFQANKGGIVSDAQGNVYIADTFNERIRKISVTGQVTTVAGDGTEGLKNGDAATATFRYPDGIAIDKDGNLYVADAGNLCIRKITPGGIVSTLAGSGSQGTNDGDAASAQFFFIGDIIADNKGNVYVTDEDRIRKVSPQGNVSTIAGSTAGYQDGDGAQAKFRGPSGLGIDAQGNLYVADVINNRIRKISFE